MRYSYKIEELTNKKVSGDFRSDTATRATSGFTLLKSKACLMSMVRCPIGSPPSSKQGMPYFFGYSIGSPALPSSKVRHVLYFSKAFPNVLRGGRANKTLPT